MSKSSISLKGAMDQTSLAQLLEDVAKGVRAGTVCLRKAAEYVTLKPAGNLEFEIEAAIKKGKQKLEIAVKWESLPEIAAPGDITISAEEPEVPDPSETEGDVSPVMEAHSEAAAVLEGAPQIAGGALAVGGEEPKDTGKKETKAKKGKQA